MSIPTHDPKRGLDAALRWLKERGKYILVEGTPKPNWGVPGSAPVPKPPRSLWDRR